MSAHVRIEMLGRLVVRVGDVECARFRTQKTAALLARLADRIGSPVPRDELLEALWPDDPELQARNSLSQAVSSLRNILEPAGTPTGRVLEATRASIRLVPDLVSTDLADFRADAEAAEKARIRGDDAAWRMHASRAVVHVKGDLLPGHYEEWSLPAREQVRLAAVQLLDRLVLAAEETSEWSQSSDLALRTLALDPHHEPASRALIRAYDAMDRPGEAVREYRRLRRALRRDLAIPPQAATRELALGALRRERSAKLGPTPMREVSPRSSASPIRTFVHWTLAAQTLTKEFADPAEGVAWAVQQIAERPEGAVTVETRRRPGLSEVPMPEAGQILADTATAALVPGVWAEAGGIPNGPGTDRWHLHTDSVPSQSRAVPLANSIPPEFDPFFGREELIDSIIEALHGGKHRIVTLTGPGGMGKTRAATRATRSARFEGGTWFVPMAEAHDAEAALRTIARSIAPAAPASWPVLDRLRGVLEGRLGLLVLDNLEQIPEDALRETMDRLLGMGPSVILATSRRRIAHPAEVEISLDPLPFSSDLTAGNGPSPAALLFLDRARALRPDFAPAAQVLAEIETLCGRLDGVPLAIELAAARIHALSPGQMLRRLDERLDLLSSRSRIERHRSLRATLDWSYGLLTPDLQTAFRRLAGFSGGWDAEVAEAVLATPVPLDTLAELRDSSLVRATETATGDLRYAMLETVREYGRSQSPTEESEAWEVENAHVFLDRLERVSGELEGPTQAEVLDGLEADRANISSSVETAIRRSMPDLALGLCGAAWRFWHLRSFIEEGRSLAERALALPGGDPLLRARAANGAGRLAYLQGDYESAGAWHEAALDAAGHDPAVRAVCHNGLGAVRYEQGRYDEAVQLFESCRALRTKLGDRFGLANALSWLGIVLTDLSRYDEARATLTDSLTLREKIGDVSGVARSLNSLGIVARRTGNPSLAEDFYYRALAIQRRMGDRRAIAGLCGNLAVLAMAANRLDEAEVLLMEGLDLSRQTGDKWGVATALANLSLVELERVHVSSACGYAADALRIRRDIGNQWGVAYSLEGAARVLAATDRADISAMALAAAAVLRDKLNAPLSPADREPFEQTVAIVRNALGQEAFRSAWERGAAHATAETVSQTLHALEAESARRGNPPAS